MSKLAMAIPDPQGVEDTEIKRILIAMKADIEALAAAATTSSATATAQKQWALSVSSTKQYPPADINAQCTITNYNSEVLEPATVIHSFQPKCTWPIPRDPEYDRFFQAIIRYGRGNGLGVTDATVQLFVDINGRRGIEGRKESALVADVVHEYGGDPIMYPTRFVIVNGFIPKNMRADLVAETSLSSSNPADCDETTTNIVWDLYPEHLYTQQLKVVET